MPRYKHIQVIINPASGRSEPIVHILYQVLQHHNLYWDISITQKDRNGKLLAQEAVQEGADLVMVYGGDGTIMEVANGLVGTEVSLAVLPGGTGNLVATEMKIPRNLTKAIELIFTSKCQSRLIDLGQIDEQYFLVNAGTGFMANVVQESDHELKRRIGIFAYVISGLKALRTTPSVWYELVVDGKKIETEAVACYIANIGSFGNRFVSFHSQIDPYDGLLDVFLLNNDLRSFLATAASITQLDDYTLSLEHWQAKEISIRAYPSQPTQADGDLISSTPSTVKVVPKALRIITYPQPSLGFL